jgi:hypothetical protein
MKTKCMSCGGSMKKMAVGGTTTKRIIKKSTGGMYGIPQENLGTSGQYGFAKKGGATKQYAKRGTKKDCPDGYTWDGTNCVKAGPFRSLGAKLGIGAGALGFIGIGASMLNDARKEKKAKKEKERLKLKALQESATIPEKKRGGATGTHKMPNGKVMLNSKMQKGGVIKAVKKVVKKITRPTLRKAQNGIEMDDNMMINKPGYSGGYKAPVRPASEYMSGKPGGVSGRTPGSARPNARPPMTRQDMINVGKDKNSPYYGASEQDMIKKGTISKPPYKKGGSTKAAKFAALAPPYNKATFADRIAGAKKKK